MKKVQGIIVQLLGTILWAKESGCGQLKG